MSTRIVLAALLLLSGAAHADEVFSHPQTATQLLQGALLQPAMALREAQVVRGNFIFRKHLQEIPQPIVSRGSFVFVKGLGIDWHTREPFDSDFVLTATGMKQIDDGKTTLQMQASAQLAVGVVAKIFLSLLSLDVESLQSSFALFGMQQGKQWQVGLRPSVPAIAAVFRDAVVSGVTQVDMLLLHDANNDQTEISFVDVQYSTRSSATDRQLFQYANQQAK